MTHPTLTKSVIETLEQRRLLAGNFTTDLDTDNDLLTIIGDNEDNQLYITLHETSDTTSRVQSGGVTSVELDTAALASAARLAINTTTSTSASPATGFSVGFDQSDASTFTFDTDDSDPAVEDDLGGVIVHTGSITFDQLDAPNGTPTGDTLEVGNFALGFDADRLGQDFGGTPSEGFFIRDTADADIVLFDVTGVTSVTDETNEYTATGDGADGGFDLRVSNEFAIFLVNAGLATTDLTGTVIGQARIDATAVDVDDDLYRVRATDFSDPSSTVDGEFEQLFARSEVQSITVGLEAGSDYVGITSLKLASVLLVDGDNGADFALVSDSTVNGEIFFDDSEPEVSDAGVGLEARVFSTRAGAVTFDGGTGNDLLQFNDSIVTGRLIARFGLGTDVLRATDTETAFNRGGSQSLIDGGEGNDLIQAVGSRFNGAIADNVELIEDDTGDGDGDS